MMVAIPYHKSSLICDLSSKYLNGIHRPPLPAPTMSGSAYVQEALDNPIDSPRLEELSRGKKNIVLIASDHTRPVPSRIIIPQMLERLRRGQPDANITILIATGLHRPSTREELLAKFGEDLLDHETIRIHDANDTDNLVEAGTLPSGGRLLLNRLVMEADLVVSEGFIEPHFFAGFSGGRKSILPGVASRETILANHCAEFISHPLARTGSLDGNPIHEDMVFAANQAHLAFIVNVIINGEHDVIQAFAGNFLEAHLQGCRWLQSRCQVFVQESDIVITTNGGYPLDQNLYQAVKGMTAGEAVCRDGGCIIIAASCCDGHGGKAFYQALANCHSLEKLWQDICAVPRNQTTPDQWQYQILVRIMRKKHIIVVTRHCDHRLIRDMHMEAASTIEEALAMARSIVGAEAKIAIIPDGVSVIATKN